MSEKTLHRAVCDYIRFQYPDVMFNSDLAGSMKLTIGQATAMKCLRSNRAFPDVSIYEPRKHYHGLFIEIKVEGTRLYNKSGKASTEHIMEQQACLCRLRNKGYIAEFGVGFDSCKSIIDDYLK